MAKNLQAKLPSTDVIHIHDINTEALHNFVAETKGSSGATVKIANSVREATEDSVCSQFLQFFPTVCTL